MKNEHVDSREPKGISRRTVNKTLAWSAPVVAAVAVAPAVAASGGTRYTASVTSSGLNKTTGSFTLPADAKDITFVVRGGGGGGSTGEGAQFYAGGSGHNITGALAKATGTMLVTLTAGAGGGVAQINTTASTSAAGGAGFGNGGGTAGIAGNEFTRHYCRGGGGGGGSALVFQGLGAQVIAGGGGGAGGYAVAAVSALASTFSGTPKGGDAGVAGGFPKQALTRAGSLEYATNNTGTTHGGGGAGAAAVGGAAPTAIPQSLGSGVEQQSAGWSMIGAAGGAGSLAAGAAGGAGVADAYSAYISEATTPGLGARARVVGQSGGGGGGYAGGAGGALRFGMRTAHNTVLNPEVTQWFAADCGAGGGGSHYVGGAQVTSSNVGVAANGGPAKSAGGAGYVEISFTSAAFTPNGTVTWA